MQAYYIKYMKKKILVVDDEAHIIKIVKARLEANNYEVLTAYDGLSGIDKAVKFKPDLILLDLMMPVMDGYEACRRLKADPDTKGIPILVFSATSQPNVIEKATQAGAADFIEKPFDGDVLTYEIDMIVNRRKGGEKEDISNR